MAAHHTTADTLALLEERVRRIAYLLHGDTTTPTSTTTSAASRLRQLERTLQHLLSRSPAAADVVALHKSQPTLFSSASTTSPASSIPPAQLAVLVLAHAPLYTSVSTQLAALKDTALPESAGFTKLVQLQARIDRVQAKQLEQAAEFAELRARSARAVERWYEGGVLDMGDRWAVWEERMRACEITVRRAEGIVKRERDGVV